jgi:hypothetical protein
MDIISLSVICRSFDFRESLTDIILRSDGGAEPSNRCLSGPTRLSPQNGHWSMMPAIVFTSYFDERRTRSTTKAIRFRADSRRFVSVRGAWMLNGFKGGRRGQTGAHATNGAQRRVLVDVADNSDFAMIRSDHKLFQSERRDVRRESAGSHVGLSCVLEKTPVVTSKN